MVLASVTGREPAKRQHGRQFSRKTQETRKQVLLAFVIFLLNCGTGVMEVGAGGGDAAMPGDARSGGPSEDAATVGPMQGPQILSFGANVTRMTEGETVTLVAVVAHSGGLQKLVGGRITDETGRLQYSALIADQQGTYSAALIWAEINRVQAIEFIGGDSDRVFVGEFYDIDGNRTTRSITIQLHCPANAACAGKCTDVAHDLENCGQCRRHCSCHPREVRCADGKREQCASDGQKFDILQMCAFGCSTTSNMCNVCPPGENRCVGDTREDCINNAAGEVSWMPTDCRAQPSQLGRIFHCGDLMLGTRPDGSPYIGCTECGAPTSGTIEYFCYNNNAYSCGSGGTSRLRQSCNSAIELCTLTNGVSLCVLR